MFIHYCTISLTLMIRGENKSTCNSYNATIERSKNDVTIDVTCVLQVRAVAFISFALASPLFFVAVDTQSAVGVPHHVWNVKQPRSILAIKLDNFR